MAIPKNLSPEGRASLERMRAFVLANSPVAVAVDRARKRTGNDTIGLAVKQGVTCIRTNGGRKVIADGFTNDADLIAALDALV